MRVLDEVWMLVSEQGEQPNVIYCIGTSAIDVWRRVLDEEIMGTGVTRETLRDQGFVAKKVSICLS